MLYTHALTGAAGLAGPSVLQLVEVVFDRGSENVKEVILVLELVPCKMKFMKIFSLESEVCLRQTQEEVFIRSLVMKVTAANLNGVAGVIVALIIRIRLDK